MIPENILQEYGAEKRCYKKGELVFSEGHQAKLYFQVATGEVKMYNYNDDGKEFIQQIFNDGDSFGEPPLFNNKPYLTSATASIDSNVWTLPKREFLQMLGDRRDCALAVCMRLSDRLYYKSLMAMEISSEHPEHRLLRFFDYLKIHVAGLSQSDKYHVNLTRQQLADLTGLRVETVIRTIKALEKKGAVSIHERKVYR